MSKLTVVYTGETAPETYSKSIFLAGPSPRNHEGLDWRTEAIAILDSLDFDGIVYSPVPRGGKWATEYPCEWERKNLQRADCIAFWVPRDMKTLPGLTTNIEWGAWYDSGRAVLGFPKEAPHCKYLQEDAAETAVPTFHTLRDTLAASTKRVASGAARSNGERDIPLIVWNKPDFQQWYAAQKSAGNRLNTANVVWTFRVGPDKSRLFLYALHVDVFIKSENRNKTNEIVLFRPDISTIVAYQKPQKNSYANYYSALLDTPVVLVREFRSPASTMDGNIHELQGGSSAKPSASPTTVAAHEFSEETGLSLKASRFTALGSRQIAGTLSAHKAHTFMVELTADEMNTLRKQVASGAHNGVEADTERTYVEIDTFEHILADAKVDWSMVGMISAALLNKNG